MMGAVEAPVQSPAPRALDFGSSAGAPGAAGWCSAGCGAGCCPPWDGTTQLSPSPAPVSPRAEPSRVLVAALLAACPLHQQNKPSPDPAAKSPPLVAGWAPTPGGSAAVAVSAALASLHQLCSARRPASDAAFYILLTNTT